MVIKVGEVNQDVANITSKNTVLGSVVGLEDLEHQKCELLRRRDHFDKKGIKRWKEIR